MNNIEEKLWSYIDGNCTPDEHAAITRLIAADEQYRLKYQELLAFNQEIGAIELDEPSMAFTYNVIEAIRAEQAQVPLKAAINKRIIRVISGFFILTLTAVLIFTLAGIDWSSAGVSVKVPASFQMPDISHYISKPIVEGFMFFDVVAALFLLDTYLRRKNISKAV